MTEDKFSIERFSVPAYFGARQFPLELWRGEGPMEGQFLELSLIAKLCFLL